MFPESSFAGQKYATLHRAMCAFRSLFTRALKVSGLNVILPPNCIHLKPPGLGKVAEFFLARLTLFQKGPVGMVPSLTLWKGALFIRSVLISFAGFTLCNSNSQMHGLALSHPWVMGMKATKKDSCSLLDPPTLSQTLKADPAHCELHVL